MEGAQAHTETESAGNGGGIVEALMLPSPGIMIWVWAIFFTLLVLLHKFAWKPILASVAEREIKLKESLSKADEAVVKAAKFEKDQQQMFADARTEAAKIISETRDFAAKLRTQSEADAKESAEKIVAQAKVEIESVQAQASATLKRDAADLSVAIAERILRSEIQGSKSQDFADKMLSETLKN